MKKDKYEQPSIEIIDLVLEDSIASSAGLHGVGLWEDNIWGDSGQ